MFIDTHCHIDDEKLNAKDSVVENMKNNNVKIAINMGCDLTSSKVSKELSKKYNEIYFGAGVHPENVSFVKGGDLKKIEEMFGDYKCVAVGEIGLDYHYEPFDKNKQIEIFVEQLSLAKKYNLPVSIHSRDSTGDMMEILRSNRDLIVGGVMHCFSGSKETAKELINLGLCIGFGGTLTFKNSISAVDCAKYLPLEYILTETDSPYLAPVPFRGSVNEPKNVKYVAEKLAEIKGVGIEKIEEQIEINTRRVFNKIK